MRDDVLRHELNVLTLKTFCFDFENWVNSGYFGGDYIPYSFEEDGKILANVSANRMNFIQNGVQKNYIQIGTVMTDEAYRKQGLARRLMEYVLKEYEGNCDGIYLFGNLSALGFYRKLGFQEGMQYRYTLKPECRKLCGTQVTFHKVDSEDSRIKEQYLTAVQNSTVTAALDLRNKYGLQMFYTAGMETVYYSTALDCFVVMEWEDETVFLQSIISKKPIAMESILAHIDLGNKPLKLEFTPLPEAAHLFDAVAFDGGEDYRLFYRGKELEQIEQDRLYFPVLSHA